MLVIIARLSKLRKNIPMAQPALIAIDTSNPALETTDSNTPLPTPTPILFSPPPHEQLNPQLNPLDLNHDGRVDWQDAYELFHRLIHHQGDTIHPLALFDLNHDGQVNSEDFFAFLHQTKQGVEANLENVKDKFLPLLVKYIDEFGSFNPILKEIILAILYTIDDSPNMPQDSLSEEFAAFTGKEIRELVNIVALALHLKILTPKPQPDPEEQRPSI